MVFTEQLRSVLAAFARGEFRRTVAGLIFPGGLRPRGVYHPYIDGVYQGPEYNLVPTQGLNYLLSAGFAGGSVNTSWYLALFSGAVTPVPGWTATSFSGLANEITSATEGYSETTRPIWTPGASVNGLIGNTASLASFSIVATTSITITGAALLSSNVKGGGGGVLGSASRFASSHTVNDGSTFELGYELELSDS